MDDLEKGNLTAFSGNSHTADSGPNSYSQKEAEDLAGSLIYEILNTSKELRTVNIRMFDPHESIQNLKQLGDALKEKLSSLCNDLESVKSPLTKAMEAMERNAQKLERQALNDLSAERLLITCRR